MSSKYVTLKNWKKRGVIHDNFDELYEKYINTFNCEHCGKEFLNTKERHLDHNHETGLFRKIVCSRCNGCDSYIKYPNGRTDELDKKRLQKWYIENREHVLENYHKNREKIRDIKNTKVTCECGDIINKSSLSRHKKSNRHIFRLSSSD